MALIAREMDAARSFSWRSRVIAQRSFPLKCHTIRWSRGGLFVPVRDSPSQAFETPTDNVTRFSIARGRTFLRLLSPFPRIAARRETNWGLEKGNLPRRWIASDTGWRIAKCIIRGEFLWEDRLRRSGLAISFLFFFLSLLLFSFLWLVYGTIRITRWWEW